MEVKRMKWEQKLEVGDDLPKTEVIVWAENISFSHYAHFMLLSDCRMREAG